MLFDKLLGVSKDEFKIFSQVSQIIFKNYFIFKNAFMYLNLEDKGGLNSAINEITSFPNLTALKAHYLPRVQDYSSIFIKKKPGHIYMLLNGHHYDGINMITPDEMKLIYYYEAEKNFKSLSELYKMDKPLTEEEIRLAYTEIAGLLLGSRSKEAA